MFDTLTERLDGVFSKLRKRGKLHPKQVDNALADVRTALLEADVAVEVADDLVNRVRSRALSEEVLKSLTPAQQVVKIVNEELNVTLGGEHRPFTLPGAPPVVVLVAGVQGSGKTTACAKLAKHLKSKGKRPLLVGADLERPAAVDQLRTLGREIGVPVWSEGRDPIKLAKNSVKEAERTGADVVIIDTAGRLHVDSEMMRQARKIKDVTKPTHVLMACDAMTGQDAVIQAREFMRDVDTTGFILTKLDGDARGGAALSMTAVTGRPIFFAGTGERLDDLEPFYPDRMAGRILGMGDVLTLIEKAQGTVDAEKAAAAAEQMLQGRFNLEDFLEQLRQMRKLGPIQDILKMLPGVPGGKNAVKEMAEEVNEAELRRAEAMILSMTLEERRNPAIISGSRRLRIANGSGTTTADVNQLLKDFEGARKMMRSMMGGKRLPGMARIPGPQLKA
ncbi:MAG: signal recognition particle protein [Actinobacteria bacterium]|nr:MAG: signal recognition particle protein [Actinomycetota bacterium]TMK22478.1 MAG: signal recognition particle protein [Actinomycetota bacterium]TMK92452.1 MAG: signal recognition particle protein [Actinomycetota bacterium]TMM24961.1 MAG: signal recognition particle protein [Actinomycetota bacterium]